MGGDCSQKAHVPEGTAILSGTLQASGSMRNQNSIANQFCQMVVYTISPAGSRCKAASKSGGGLWWRPTR
jgi:hypothetical protein